MDLCTIKKNIKIQSHLVDVEINESMKRLNTKNIRSET